MTEPNNEPLTVLANEFEQGLLQRYGPVVGQDELRQALGYSSQDAFRQALARGRLPVPVFSIAGRRGKYALSKDIALWLAQLRHAAMSGQAAGGGAQQN